MAPTELAPNADGSPVFCFGLAGFERDGLKEKFLKECPVRADQVAANSMPAFPEACRSVVVCSAYLPACSAHVCHPALQPAAPGCPTPACSAELASI